MYCKAKGQDLHNLKYHINEYVFNIYYLLCQTHTELRMKAQRPSSSQTINPTTLRDSTHSAHCKFLLVSSPCYCEEHSLFLLLCTASQLTPFPTEKALKTLQYMLIAVLEISH